MPGSASFPAQARGLTSGPWGLGEERDDGGVPRSNEGISSAGSVEGKWAFSENWQDSRAGELIPCACVHWLGGQQGGVGMGGELHFTRRKTEVQRGQRRSRESLASQTFCLPSRPPRCSSRPLRRCHRTQGHPPPGKRGRICGPVVSRVDLQRLLPENTVARAPGKSRRLGY